MIIIGRPLEEGNKILFFNEIMVTGYLYLLISLSLESSKKENLGLGLCCLVLFTFIVNILNLLKNTILYL
jgi:hypothetical protein